MVGDEIQHYSGNDFSISTSSFHSDNGCVSIGVGGGSYRDPQSEWSMDPRPEAPAYKHFGATSCVLRSERDRIAHKPVREENSHSNRQYHSCCIYQQAGGDKIPYLMSSHKAAIPVVHSSGDSPFSS